MAREGKRWCGKSTIWQAQGGKWSITAPSSYKRRNLVDLLKLNAQNYAFESRIRNSLTNYVHYCEAMSTWETLFLQKISFPYNTNSGAVIK